MKIIRKIFKYLIITILVIIGGIIIWLLLPNPNSDFDETPRESTQYWELNTGSKIAYTHLKSKIDTIKSTIIYLHGGPGAYIDDSKISTFEEFSKKGYEVYLYDQIGCGLSERLNNPEEYTVQRHSNDLEEILNIVKSKNTTLIGQSWGGFLASYFASYHPEYVDKIVLTSPGGIKPADSLITEKYEPNLIIGLTNIDDRTKVINEKISNSFILKEKLWLALGTTVSTSFVSNHKVDGILHKTSKVFAPVLVCDTANTPSEPKGRPGMYCSIFTNKSYKDVPLELRDKMKLFSNPVLILKADCDYISWQETYEYKELFPNTKLKVIKDAGHSICIENKTDYISEILRFLEPNK